MKIKTSIENLAEATVSYDRLIVIAFITVVVLSFHIKILLFVIDFLFSSIALEWVELELTSQSIN